MKLGSAIIEVMPNLVQVCCTQTININFEITVARSRAAFRYLFKRKSPVRLNVDIGSIMLLIDLMKSIKY